MDAFAKNGSTACKEKMDSFFNKFDSKNTGFLDRSQFDDLVGQVFARRGQAYPADSKLQKELFEESDIDGDGKISKTEFEMSWKTWLSQVFDPVSALVVVDVQHDFVDGLLPMNKCPARQEGYEVIPVINKLMADIKFDAVIYTLDWHPPDHISFFKNRHLRKFHPLSKVKFEDAKMYDRVVFDVKPRPMPQILWPEHCVFDTHGAQIHSDLKIHDPHVIVKKGYHPELDSYSAFWDNGKLLQTSLLKELYTKHVTDVYVVGIAYDFCVGSTAAHSAEHGFRTVFIDDAVRGVDEQGMQNMKQKLKDRGVLFTQSNEVADLVGAKDRPPLLGHSSLRSFRESIEVAESNAWAL